MKRILAILLVFILLVSAPHDSVQRALPGGPFQVGPKPVAVPINLASRGYGPLRLYGAWELTSGNKAFGGLSALFVRPDGQFTAISDSGEWFNFGIGVDAVDALQGSLPRFPEEANEARGKWDSESIARDPVSGRLWVGFERMQRICRYTADFAKIEACAEPAEMADWSQKDSLESLVRFGDGRFLAIQEEATLSGGLHDVLLWASDPVEESTQAPVHLSYAAPEGYRPTDALWLGGDRLLVMNRRLSAFDGGFTARLVLIRLPALTAGAALSGEVITQFDRSGPIDNLEAMALTREGGGPELWIASDDNHLFLQKTLLYRFALPADWVSDDPAPGATKGGEKLAPKAPAIEATEPTPSE